METVRESVFKLLDYRGDIQKNIETGTTHYSADFSPNNIRRVVISSDGVLVQYHKGIKGTCEAWGSNTYVKYITFRPGALLHEQLNPKYKPLLSLFAEKNIYASVEEIILLSQPINEMSGDINRENDVSYMVSGYNGTGNLQDKVKNRFKRLRYYTVYNMTFPMFVSGMISYRKAENNLLAKPYLSDCDELKSYVMNKIELNDEETARTSICTQTGAYAFDSTLRAYFEGVRDGYLEGKKKDKVDAFKKERKAKDVDDVNESLKKYVSAVKTFSKYKKIFNTCGTNGVVTADIVVPRIVFDPVYKFDGICSIPDSLIKNVDEGLKEILEYNKKLNNSCKATLRDELANTFFNAVGSLANADGRYTLAAMMQFDDKRAVYVSSQSQRVAKILQENYNITFESDSSKPTPSIINCYWLMCMFFLDRDSELYRPEYITRDFWEKEVTK